jgi:hypothetical protein
MKTLTPLPPGDLSNPSGELVEPRLGTSGASFDRLRTGVVGAAEGAE